MFLSVLCVSVLNSLSLNNHPITSHINMCNRKKGEGEEVPVPGAQPETHALLCISSLQPLTWDYFDKLYIPLQRHTMHRAKSGIHFQRAVSWEDERGDAFFPSKRLCRSKMWRISSWRPLDLLLQNYFAPEKRKPCIKQLKTSCWVLLQRPIHLMYLVSGNQELVFGVERG